MKVSSNPICPECESEKYRLNALFNFTVEEIGKQFMYTCAVCQTQYNLDDDSQEENSEND